MKITEAVPQGEYKLFLRFEDGVAGEVDLSALAGRGVFAAWRQPGVFERVTVTEAGAAEWPGEVDLCPDALYMQLTGLSPDEVFSGLRSLASHA
jgi:hypothetical protein